MSQVQEGQNVFVAYGFQDLFQGLAGALSPSAHQQPVHHLPVKGQVMCQGAHSLLHPQHAQHSGAQAATQPQQCTAGLAAAAAGPSVVDLLLRACCKNLVLP